jgi:hypothetical protein
MCFNTTLRQAKLVHRLQCMQRWITNVPFLPTHSLTLLRGIRVYPKMGGCFVTFLFVYLASNAYSDKRFCIGSVPSISERLLFVVYVNAPKLKSCRKTLIICKESKQRYPLTFANSLLVPVLSDLPLQMLLYS